MHVLYLSIGELARQSGTRPSALRYYESLGLLPIADRERWTQILARTDLATHCPHQDVATRRIHSRRDR